MALAKTLTAEKFWILIRLEKLFEFTLLNLLNSDIFSFFFFMLRNFLSVKNLLNN